MIIREIHYYLLTGPEGEDFKFLGTYETSNNQIARAISRLRENYHAPVRLAELAAFAVGYESPTQFNREYKRQFGEPPRKDVQRIMAK